MEKHSFDKIDWSASERSDEIRRPFTAKVEESVARAFINAVRRRGLFVRETLVKLMREFVEYEKLGHENGQSKGTGEVPNGSSEQIGPDRR